MEDCHLIRQRPSVSQHNLFWFPKSPRLSEKDSLCVCARVCRGDDSVLLFYFIFIYFLIFLCFFFSLSKASNIYFFLFIYHFSDHKMLTEKSPMPGSAISQKEKHVRIFLYSFFFSLLFSSAKHLYKKKKKSFLREFLLKIYLAASAFIYETYRLFTFIFFFFSGKANLQ